jgi:hypothetical protein
MQIILRNRICSIPLLAVLLPLLLSGCLRGHSGGEKNVLTSETIEVTVPAGKAKPAVKELPAVKPAAERTKPEPSPPAETKPIPRQLNPQSPEGIMTERRSAPPPPRPQPEAPQSGTAVPARREVATARPDFAYHGEMLTEDTAWHGMVLIEGGVIIAPQTTLTITSGTVVRFRRRAAAGAAAVLVVQGRIVVNGSADRPVVFTSTFDEVAAGDWQGIVLLATGKKNLLEQCRVEGAETGLDASFSTVTLNQAFFAKCRTGARLQDSHVVMTGGGSGGSGTGLTLYDSEVDIRNADFSGNNMGILAERTSLLLAGAKLAGNERQALIAESCRLNIAGNSFTANGSGLSLTGCEGLVSANRIAKNGDYGLALANSRVKVSGNEIERNGRVGLRAEDGKGIAWGNVLLANGDYDLYNAGPDDFRAFGNWWGRDVPADVAGRIYGRHVDGGRSRVLYFPVLLARPLLALP